MFVKDGVSEIVLLFEEWYMNMWSIVYGGVMMMFVDIVFVMVVCSLIDDGVGVVMVEMKVNFM